MMAQTIIDRERRTGRKLGATPSPQRGEGRGEGAPAIEMFVTPSPHPSPQMGRGSRAVQGDQEERS
jgi:hypothetical protein